MCNGDGSVMAIRIEVQPDGAIEIMRPRGPEAGFVYCRDLEHAMVIIKYLMKRDLRAAKREKFVPDLDRECKQLLKQELNARR